MKNFYNVPQNDLIEETALELKKIEFIKPPSWAEFVKTGAHKERPPARDDWWYVRAAAILKSIQKMGPIGVSKLRSKYGGKKNRGMKPEQFYPGSGKIIRMILQQLESAGLVKKEEKGIHKGRVISPKGISLFDKVASRISGKKPEKKQDERKAKPEKTNTGKTQEDKINRKIKDEGNDSKKVKDNPESNQIAEKQKQK